MSHLTGTTCYSPANLTTEALARMFEECRQIIDDATLYVDLYASDVLDRPVLMKPALIGLNRPPNCHNDKQWLSLVIPKADAKKWLEAVDQPHVVLRTFGLEAEQPAGMTLENAPLGTRAPANIGGAWVRVPRGWQWNGKHSIYPRPGGDWNGKLIPPTTTEEKPA
jgi:hypothetical protein